MISWFNHQDKGYPVGFFIVKDNQLTLKDAFPLKARPLLKATAVWNAETSGPAPI